jgi:hypothetical protein
MTLMKQPSIPKQIQDQVIEIVADFNRKTFQKTDHGYRPRFRGRFLYLDRADLGSPSAICRLTYSGKMEDWEFAIYLHSKDRYDPEEWFFPGSEKCDGTVMGAMQAGLIAYPVIQDTPLTKAFRTVFGLFVRH